MSKRDDLDKEAKGEIGALGMILLGIVGMGVKTLMDKNTETDEQTETIKQVDRNYEKICHMTKEIDEEIDKPVFKRDNDKISFLKQIRAQLIEENENLKNKL